VLAVATFQRRLTVWLPAAIDLRATMATALAPLAAEFCEATARTTVEST